MAFVGTERLTIVRDLRALYEAAVAERIPYLVSLEAETGWGKTRIVQEFYADLQRSGQHGQRYWPPDIVPPGEDPMRGRKLVHPENPTPEPGSTMPWLWWGVRCERDSSGRPVRALLSDRIQLRAHLDALISAANRRQEDREIALELLGEVLGMLPAIGSVISATDAVRRLGPKLHRRVLDGIERRAKRNTPEQARIETSGSPSPSEFEAELELVARLITPELPLVLVIDDAHVADSNTVHFVRELMKLRVPALVVATAWPSVLDDQRADEHDVPPDERRTFGGFLDALRARRHDQLWAFRLRPLDGRALVTLIDEVAPSTSPDRREALLEACDGNPLVLSLQLTSRRVQRSMREGAIELSVPELGRLPRAFEGLVVERFEDLGHLEQSWLAEAAWQGEVFFPEFLSIPLQGLDEERLGGFVRFMPRDGLAVARFIERPVFAAIAAAAAEEFSDDERAEWLGATLARVTEWWHDDAPPLPAALQIRGEFCRFVVRLCDQSASAPREVAIRAALHWSWAERDMAHHAIELQAAERAVDVARGARASSAALRIQAKARLAAALLAQNRREPAIESARAAVTMVEADRDVPSSVSWDAVYVLVQALLANDDNDEAEAVIDGMEKRFARDDEVRLDYLRLRAAVCADADRTSEAEALLEEALALVRERAPDDVELLIDIETDLLALDPFYGRTDRWLAMVDLAESKLGRGHVLFRHSVLMAAQALVLAAAIPEAAKLVRRLGDPSASGIDRRSELLVQMINVVAEERLDQFGEICSQLAIAPYASREEEQDMRDVAAASDISLGRRPDIPSMQGADRPRSALAILARWDASTDTGVEQLHDLLASGERITKGQQIYATSAATMVLARHWLSTDAPHPRTAAIVSMLEPMTEQPGFPPLVRRRFRPILDAARILGGSDPEPLELVAGDHISVVQDRALRVMAWAYRGDRARAEEELRAGQAVLQAWGRPSRMALRTIAEAATAADLPGREDLWRDLVERGEAEPRDALNDLAGMARDLYLSGRYPEALKIERRVTDGLSALLGENHLETLRAQENLAATFHELGDLSAARELKQRVVDAYRRSLGNEHPVTVGAMGSLGVTLFACGDLVAARREQTEVLATRRLALGEAHPMTLLAKRNLAITLDALGEHDAALDLRTAILAARRTTLGDDHPDTLDAKAGLALSLTALGDEPAARVLEEEVLAAQRLRFGEGDPKTLDAKRNLATTLHRLGELDAARALEEEVVQARRATLGEEHHYTVDAKSRLAVTLHALGDLPAARALQEDVVAGLRDVHGDEHRETVRAKHNLAVILHDLGHLAAARALKEEVLAARRRAEGGDHEDTLAIMQSLVITLEALGDADAARALRAEVRVARGAGANGAAWSSARSSATRPATVRWTL